MNMTESAIHTGLFRDLYVALGEGRDMNTWSVRIQIKPMVDWIWFGCLLMALGGVLAVSDRRYRLSARQRQPETITPAATAPVAAHVDN
jgi:cytochrome c-type biogenesis protein CcmF